MLLWKFVFIFSILLGDIKYFNNSVFKYNFSSGTEPGSKGLLIDGTVKFDFRQDNGVFPKWNRTFTKFSEFSEFRESDKSLKHELG